MAKGLEEVKKDSEGVRGGRIGRSEGIVQGGGGRGGRVGFNKGKWEGGGSSKWAGGVVTGRE